MPPAALRVPPNANISCHSLQKEGSFLRADDHPKPATPAHIHGAPRHPPAVERPNGAHWGLAQEAVWQLCQASLYPLHPPLQREVVPSSAIRGYSASSALITVSSSLITVVMIGLWPVNSFKETSHYRRGREILLWV